MTTQERSIVVRQLTPGIGAEIIGASLKDATPDELSVVKDAVHRHKVVFLRGQQDITGDILEEFASALGHLQKYPGTTEKSLVISNHVVGNDVWHCDGSYMDRVPQYSLLHALVVPPSGGDTLWANAAHAYALMPQVLRDFADSLRVRHSNVGNLIDVERSQATPAPTLEALHPLVHVLPETGERALMLGDHAQYIPGLTKQESAALIALFQSRIELPENTIRWSWKVGDIAIWDGRNTLHYAVPDYGDDERTIRRIWISGERPLSGVDGFESEAVRQKNA
ncbi:TauD/TfdA family dioxygenase [Streptomyces sp. NPDC013172]|uniref:TauD/TfdA dioxygenase family protein n=1 Tax=Streptomyces sp. NPDC013172 TaxID=3155009 RepID=UPI0033C92924